MKLELRAYSGCTADEFLNTLRRALKREKIDRLSVLTLYLQPKIDKTIKLRVANCDRLPLDQQPDDTEVLFD